MHTSSTQAYHRFGILFALASFIGCGLFSMLYFYKEKELADALTAQAEEIKELEMRCAAETGTVARSPACDQAADLHVRLHRERSIMRAYRSKAGFFLALSCALPLVLLAASCWWYWVLTGRLRPRKRRR